MTKSPVTTIRRQLAPPPRHRLKFIGSIIRFVAVERFRKKPQIIDARSYGLKHRLRWLHSSLFGHADTFNVITRNQS